MVKKIIVLLLFAVLAAGCSQGAQDIYDSARLEEKQNNPEHAAQLYRELLKKYPGSDQAREARQRLSQLEGGGAGVSGE